MKIFWIWRPIFYPIWPLCLYGETSVFDTWFEEVWTLTRHGVTQYGSDICYLQYGDLWLCPVPNVTRDDPDKAEWKHHDIHRFIHEAELGVGGAALWTEQLAAQQRSQPFVWIFVIGGGRRGGSQGRRNNVDTLRDFIYWGKLNWCRELNNFLRWLPGSEISLSTEGGTCANGS